jgi:alkyl sulfatase BDS1-like metallo-beta-lactamase superfamily hydrolase
MPYRANVGLVDHARQFRRDLVQIAPRMWTAVGFAASNVHVLEGDSGLVVIDTSESTSAAQDILGAVRAHTSKPVRTIIYTHGHRDHVGGASVFADAGTPDTPVQILAYKDFTCDLARGTNVRITTVTTDAARNTRMRRQIGGALPAAARVSLGCGPAERPTEGMGAGYLTPTRFIGPDGATLQEDGLCLSLRPALGESDDHLIVWHEGNKVLFCGDNYYAAFPNLYAICGTRYRDFEIWAATLEQLLDYSAEVLAPGHTRPVVGAQTISEALSDYRDAIRYIITATAEGLNAGRSVDELAHSIKLPQALSCKPHLAEVFGRLPWAVRAYACGTLGWFDGNPTNLSRLSPRNEAERFIRMAGGAAAVLTEIEETDDPQWSMELCDRLIAAGKFVSHARVMKHACLKVLAESELNACARNYYLSAAQEMDI